MVGYLREVSRYASYALGFPSNFCCWHFHKSDLIPSEALHLVVVTARARDSTYGLNEIEQAQLEQPEKHRRSVAARKAWLKRLKRSVQT